MSKIEFLIDQIIESRNFVNRLVLELPQDLWYTIPEGTDSNFTWQIGHLMMAQNYHAIAVISGINEKVTKLIPVRRFAVLFNGMGSLHRSAEKDLVPTSILKEQFDRVHEICLDGLSKLNDDILGEELEPLSIKHPIARTKYEALSWSFKHEMWHSAEMEEIKRRLGYPVKWK